MGAATSSPEGTRFAGPLTRRRRGAPRRLLLDAARDLFSRNGYTGTSTREIAERAGVSETLLFRSFGSKAGLFRQAVVVPFVEVVERFETRWKAGLATEPPDEEAARQLIGELFDLFRRNRALVVLLWAAQTPSDDLTDNGVVDEVNGALQVLVHISAHDITRRGGVPARHPEVATRTTIAMIAGMAVFGAHFYGNRVPPRRDIVDVLTSATLHGHLHRRV